MILPILFDVRSLRTKKGELEFLYVYYHFFYLNYSV